MGSCYSKNSRNKQDSSPSSRPYSKRKHHQPSSASSSPATSRLQTSGAKSVNIQKRDDIPYSSFELIHSSEAEGQSMASNANERPEKGSDACGGGSIGRRFLGSKLPKFGTGSVRVAPTKSDQEPVESRVKPSEVKAVRNKANLEEEKVMRPPKGKGRGKEKQGKDIQRLGSVVDPGVSSSSSSLSSGLSNSSYTTKSSNSSVILVQKHPQRSLKSIPCPKPKTTSTSPPPPPAHQQTPNNGNKRENSSLGQNTITNRNFALSSSDARNGNVISAKTNLSRAEPPPLEHFHRREVQATIQPTRMCVNSKLPAAKYTTHISGLPKPQTAQMMTTFKRSAEHSVASSATVPPPKPSQASTSRPVQNHPHLQHPTQSRQPIYGFGFRETCPYKRPTSGIPANNFPAPAPKFQLKPVPVSASSSSSKDIPIRSHCEGFRSQGLSEDKSLGVVHQEVKVKPSRQEIDTSTDTGVSSLTSLSEAGTDDAKEESNLAAPGGNRLGNGTRVAEIPSNPSNIASDGDGYRIDSNCNPLPEPTREPSSSKHDVETRPVTSSISETEKSIIPNFVPCSSNSFIPASYEQLKSIRGIRRRSREKSLSMSSGEATPIVSSPVSSPEKGSPEHRTTSTSAGSTSGNDMDRDFLIDDEICDQPELVLSTTMDEVDKTLKQSLSELESLKSMQSQEFHSPISSVASSSPSSLVNNPTTKFRKPRALSLIESPDGSFGFDGTSYRSLMQDINGFKTLLFRLQGLLQNAETLNPFDHQLTHNKLFQSLCEEHSATEPGVNDIIQENIDLKRQVVLLQQQVEDRDKTVKLLQQQMTKYLNVNGSSEGPTGEKLSVNAASQTERCASHGISPRSVSDGSNGMLVSPFESIKCEDLTVSGESEC